MKTNTKWFLALFIAILAVSCQQEEINKVYNGNASFSLSQVARSNGKSAEIATPTSVILSIKFSDGRTQENIKLDLFSFGQEYVSENISLPVGDYQLTKFLVLDVSNRVVYATPNEGSAMAHYVADPLPINFTINNNEGTQVIPQVLTVSSTDTPESFGYANLGFEVVDMVTNLDIHLQYPELNAYDSAFIIFKNPTREIRQKLTLNNSSRIATGLIHNIPCEEWSISTVYYNAITADYKSLETDGKFDLLIRPTTTGLSSDKTMIYVQDGSTSIQKSLSWTKYYYYQLYLANRVEGFVRLPKDPTDPFIEISTVTPKWVYMFTDRSFYDTGNDGTSAFYQGGAAFESYGTEGETHDRLSADIQDTTSLVAGIGGVSNKVWNNADCLIILVDYAGDELQLYHEWDLRAGK